MSTPRTIKASEVRKGMRVRVEESLGEGTTQTTEGSVVSDASPTAHPEFVDLGLDGVTIGLDPDYPVTVLADPEPEWVEGAWYHIESNGLQTYMCRVADGWTDWLSGKSATWSDDPDEHIAVLGRVLIVDWPGDDVVRELDAINDANRSDALSHYGGSAMQNTILRSVADAIRTQGGVR